MTTGNSAGSGRGGRIDHLFASAIFDSENTARLQEHPEEMNEYLRRARALRHHMKTLGIAVTRCRRDDRLPGVAHHRRQRDHRIRIVLRSAPSGNRTYDLSLRKRLLYPAELWEQLEPI